MRSSERLIVALDEPAAALALARAVRGVARTVKVGSVLFTAQGPAVVRRLRALGFDVMLDLKFFDIPSTVECSCRAAARLGVSSLTVHASGGREMLEAAVRGARDGARGRPPRVLAVTVLTSQGASAWARARVRRLATLARDAGCDGVVASAREARLLRPLLGRGKTIVCPGIRPDGAVRGDQRRVATPATALRDGADALVIGRPITAARDPRAAARAILEEMKEGGGC